MSEQTGIFQHIKLDPPPPNTQPIDNKDAPNPELVEEVRTMEYLTVATNCLELWCLKAIIVWFNFHARMRMILVCPVPGIPLILTDFTTRHEMWNFGYTRRCLVSLYYDFWHWLYAMLYAIQIYGLWKLYGLFGMDWFHRIIGPAGSHIGLGVFLINATHGGGYEIPDQLYHPLR